MKIHYGLFAVLALFVLIVIVRSSFILMRVPDSYSESLFLKDSSMGWRLRPDKKEVIWTRRDGDREVFRVPVSTTEYGTRVVNQDHQSPPHHLLFFGDSNIYGHGLTNKETLPSQTAALDSGKLGRAYNFAVGGYGPGSFLAQTEKLNLADVVKEQSGLSMYFHFGFHVPRTFVKSSEVFWAYRSPYIRKNEKGEIIAEGLFFLREPLRALSYFFINFSGLGELTRREWARDGTQDREFVCQLYKQAALNLQKRLPETQFVLVIHPLDLSEQNREMADCVTKSGIMVWFEPKALSFERANFLEDGHVSSQGNRVVAQWLDHRIRSYLLQKEKRN